MQKVMQNVKTWLKNNALVLLYFLFAVLIEMIAVLVVEGTPFLTRPFLSLGLLFVVCGVILLIPSNKARTFTCMAMLLLQAVLDLVFSVIFDMTDQYFDLGMLSLRNDAFAILESIPVNFVTFYAGFFFCVMFLIYGLRFSYGKRRSTEPKKSAFFYVGLILAGIATMGISFVCYFPRSSQDKYNEMVDGTSGSVYSSYGMIGNLLGEAGNMLFQDRTPVPSSEIDEFLYADKVSTPTEHFGIAKDKNVVMILAESLEWYTFLRGDSVAGANEGEYPNALDITAEDLAFMYPNLTKYYQESVVMSNFHGREKTDIAETLSIVGNYPTGAYINYDYPDNNLPYTLPNMLKRESPEMSCRSFHNGFKSFYNRAEAHQMFGFEELMDMDDMDKMSNEAVEEGTAATDTFKNYMDDGERNLDSEMIETAKELMFPKDKRFFTYITTITMHGMYYDRANMQPENNQKLAEKILCLQKYKPTDETQDDYENALGLYYYMTTGLELDYMLGCLDRELAERGVYDDTVVVLFGDHNAYYQGMSNYVKGIADYDTDKKFTDLYNVPLMIRDVDLVAKLGEKRIVDKFTCTADIVPTMLDLLGITYYTNLYYGHSVFAEEESVLYSRAYGVFLSDGILRRSVNGELYQYTGGTETGVPVADKIAAFEKEGKTLVEKIKYCDYIFKQDHFGKKVNYDTFAARLKALNV